MEDFEWCVEKCLYPPQNSSMPNIIVEHGGILLGALAKKEIHFSEFGFKGVIEDTLCGITQANEILDQGKHFSGFDLYQNPITNIVFKNLLPREYMQAILRMPGFTLLATKSALVIGYGITGKTVADSLRSLSMSVTVSETNPVRALKAAAHGLKTAPTAVMATRVDYIICCTNMDHSLTQEVMLKVQSGTVVINMTQNIREIDLGWIKKGAKVTHINEFCQKVTFKDPESQKSKYFLLIFYG